jgi:hypothetical protein
VAELKLAVKERIVLEISIIQEWFQAALVCKCFFVSTIIAASSVNSGN